MNRREFLYKYLKHGHILNVGNAEYGGTTHRKLSECPDCTIHGIDIFPIDLPRQMLGSVESIPCADNIFDCVYMGEIIEHVYRPFDALKEAYRVLKPSGRLLIDTPNPYSLSRIVRYLLTGRDTLGNPEHKWFFSVDAMRRMLTELTFTFTIETENNFKTHRIGFPLPNMRPFNQMGECLLIRAEKGKKDEPLE